MGGPTTATSGSSTAACRTSTTRSPSPTPRPARNVPTATSQGSCRAAPTRRPSELLRIRDGRSRRERLLERAAQDLCRRLGTAENGLTSAEAAARLARYGPNVLRAGKRQTFLLLLLSRFRNPLVLLLIAASAVSALTGDFTSSAIVIAMAILSVMLDSVQEYRAGQAAERLKLSVAVQVSVLRDGTACTKPVRDLVPGDVVLLAAGDLIPADGRVLEARDCFVNQALLTG